MDPSTLAFLPDNVKLKILDLCIPKEDSNTQNINTRSQTVSTVTGTPTSHSAAHSAPILPQLDSKLAVIDCALTDKEILLARQEADVMLQERGKKARMGGAQKLMSWGDDQFRGDVSCWLHRHELAAADYPALLACMNTLEGLRPQLSNQGYDVGGSVTFQLACYPGGGKGYVRHADASPTCPTRTITAIVYLNPDWPAETGGGQLVIYNVPRSCMSRSETQVLEALKPTFSKTREASERPELSLKSEDPEAQELPLSEDQALEVVEASSRSETVASKALQPPSRSEDQAHIAEELPSESEDRSSEPVKSTSRSADGNSAAVNTASSENSSKIEGVSQRTVSTSFSGRLDMAAEVGGSRPEGSYLEAGMPVRADCVPATADAAADNSERREETLGESLAAALFSSRRGGNVVVAHTGSRSERSCPEAAIAASADCTEVTTVPAAENSERGEETSGESSATASFSSRRGENVVVAQAGSRPERSCPEAAIAASIECTAVTAVAAAENSEWSEETSGESSAPASSSDRWEVNVVVAHTGSRLEGSCPAAAIAASAECTAVMAVTSAENSERSEETSGESSAPASFSGGREVGVVVAPLGGRLVVMDSLLEHEVLPSLQPRYAITAWFHKKPRQAEAKASTDVEMKSSEAAELRQQQPHQETQHDLTKHDLTSRQVDQDHENRSRRSSMTDSPVASSSSRDLKNRQVDQEGENLSQRSGMTDCLVARSSSRDLKSRQVDQEGESRSQRSGMTGCPAENSSSGDGCRSREKDITTLSILQDRVPLHLLCSSLLDHGNNMIFVSVAAYRDPETPHTLADLFRKAKHPELVRVGLVSQVELEGNCDDCCRGVAASRAHPEWRSWVREIVIPAAEATGPVRARALAAALWSGEEYWLQIDSHMRFVPGWDQLCRSQLEQAEALLTAGESGAVLSTYPLGYDGSGPAVTVPDNAPVTLLCAGSYGPEGFPRIIGRTLRTPPPTPMPSLFWAAGFSFSRATLFTSVAPYPPNLPYLFFGEELYMLARMWTRGWRVFAPNSPIIFHQWERSARPHTVGKDVGPNLELRSLSQAMVKAVLGFESSPGAKSTNAMTDNADVKEGSSTQIGAEIKLPAGWGIGEVWSIGRTYSLEQFLSYVGLDLQSQTMSQHAKQGGITDPLLFC